MILFWDTETSGMFNFRKHYSDPSQPKLLQLAAILDDENRKTVATFYAPIAVDPACPIEPGAAAVHGLDHKFLAKAGMPLKTACSIFGHMKSLAHAGVGHNIGFDIKIMAAAYSELGAQFTLDIPAICTMHSTTNILKLPGTRGYKWPKLDEAYRALIDTDGFEGAHDALADVLASRAIYYHLADQGKPLHRLSDGEMGIA